MLERIDDMELSELLITLRKKNWRDIRRISWKFIGKRINGNNTLLDRICGNYKDLFAFIRNLLSFWFSHNNRFTNIKAKIFLRSDLYNAKALQFVDSSKMRAYHLELKWDTLSLYRMLVKRMANAGSDILLKYLQDVPDLLSLNTVNELGYMPGDSEESFLLQQRRCWFMKNI